MSLTKLEKRDVAADDLLMRALSVLDMTSGDPDEAGDSPDMERHLKVLRRDIRKHLKKAGLEP